MEKRETVGSAELVRPSEMQGLVPYGIGRTNIGE